MAYAHFDMANLSRAGIMAGRLAALMPERRADITQLAMKSAIAGTLATCRTGAAVGPIGG